jgi:hypothetical protein
VRGDPSLDCEARGVCVPSHPDHLKYSNATFGDEQTMLIIATGCLRLWEEVVGWCCGGESGVRGEILGASDICDV